MKKQYSLPPTILNFLEEKRLSSSRKDKALADAILKLSDHFVFSTGEKTPWQSNETFEAYLFYFFTLNAFRWLKVSDHANYFHFFTDNCELVDFGAGLGTASLSLVHSLQRKFKSVHLIESSEKALFFLEQNKNLFPCEVTLSKNLNTHTILPNQILLFSYSLVELGKVPDWAFQFEKIIIVEPSTQTVGRQLMQTRKIFQDQGFTVVAPCTHQGACPQLEKSKTDWCHDRVEIHQPEWFQKLEAQLPIKNKTLTFSYLILEKKTQSKSLSKLSEKSLVRVVGDPLFEKGRTRQMICQNEDRQYISMLDRDCKQKGITNWPYDRGDLIELPNEFESKSNEIRLK